MKYRNAILFGILSLCLFYVSASFFVRDTISLTCDRQAKQCVIQQEAERVIIPLDEIDSVTLDSHICGRMVKQPYIRIRLNSGKEYAFPGGQLPILPTTQSMICNRYFPRIQKQLHELNEFLISEYPNQFKIAEEANYVDYYWGAFLGVLALLLLGLSIKKI